MAERLLFQNFRIGNRMLLEHERYHGLGMDALATVCSWNTNVIMVWAWAHCQPYALGTRTLSWFGHGRIGNRMLLEHERYHGLGNRMLLEHERYHGLSMGALPTVCSGNTNVSMVWAWMLLQPYALGTRTLSWFGHGCSGNRMLLEHERYHGLSMGALPTVCSWNTNVIMVWAWMLWQPYALGTRTLSWFGHGCSGNRMLLEHERYHGLGMGALATVCSWNTNVIMVWAWMLWQAYAPRACCAGILTRCRAVAERLTFQNVRFIRGRSWRTYQKQLGDVPLEHFVAHPANIEHQQL